MAPDLGSTDEAGPSTQMAATTPQEASDSSSESGPKKRKAREGLSPSSRRKPTDEKRAVVHARKEQVCLADLKQEMPEVSHTLHPPGVITLTLRLSATGRG